MKIAHRIDPLRPLAILLAFALFTPLAAGQGGGPAQLNGYRHLIFANSYQTVDAAGRHDDFVVLGNYDFLDERDVQINYFVYDARKNAKPGATPVRAPLLLPSRTGRPPGVLHIPRYDAQKSIRGTWRLDGSMLRIQIGTVYHDWALRDPAQNHFELAGPYTNAQDGSHVIEGLTYTSSFGYAYLADEARRAQPITRSELVPAYQGAMYALRQQGGTAQWVHLEEELHVSWYRSFEGGNVLGYVESDPKLNPPMLTFSYLLLNYAPYSKLLIYTDVGHDFNRDGVYNELGHSSQMFGIYEKGRVGRIVFIEYSYQTRGYPLLGVGHYYGVEEGKAERPLRLTAGAPLPHAEEVRRRTRAQPPSSSYPPLPRPRVWAPPPPYPEAPPYVPPPPPG